MFGFWPNELDMPVPHSYGKSPRELAAQATPSRIAQSHLFHIQSSGLGNLPHSNSLHILLVIILGIITART